MNDTQLISLLSDEDKFTSVLKTQLAEIAPGQWVGDGKRNFRYKLSDGSVIRLKFFDTVKKIYNSKNVEIPGRESFLSYVDVVVTPVGLKAYAVKINVAQHVWGTAKLTASAAHAASIAKLQQLAEKLKITLDGQWETYYARD